MKKPAKRGRHDRRIYNAAASGARQLFEYVSNFLEGGSPKCEAWDVFLRYRDMLTEEKPEVDVATSCPWTILPADLLQEIGHNISNAENGNVTVAMHPAIVNAAYK